MVEGADDGVNIELDDVANSDGMDVLSPHVLTN